MADHEIKRALGGKGTGKLHTHSVHYERADNGGLHAHVARHTSDGAHHHTEHHVLADPEDAVAHMQEHLGDQPAIGAAPPDAGGGAPGGDGAAGGGEPEPAAAGMQ
jgi:hypothetical protein